MAHSASPSDLAPRRNPSSSFRRIGDEGGLVVLPDHAEVKVLNPTAIEIYPLLDGEHTYGQIASHIAEEFDITLEQALQDVLDFVGSLRDHGMLASGSSGRGGNHE